MPQFKLIYFDTAGFAEGIRYLFAIAGKPFEDERIPITADRKLPEAIKKQCPWGQVPLLYVDGKVISQSSAIFRYLAKEFGYAGKNNFEGAKCDEYVDAAKDFITEGGKVFQEKDEKKQAEMKKTLQEVTAAKFFERITKIIQGNGGKWLVGNSITWADLYVANFVEVYDCVLAVSDSLVGFPILKDYLLRILAIPEVKKFRTEHPLNDPVLKRKY